MWTAAEARSRMEPQALAGVVRSKPWWRSVGGDVGAGNGVGAGPRTYFTTPADRVSGTAVQEAPRRGPKRVPGSAPPSGAEPKGANNTLPYVKPLFSSRPCSDELRHSAAQMQF